MNDLHHGEKLGRHRLVTQLAKGGMGIVWLARSEGPFGFEKLTVVKELKPSLASDPAFREMFLEEARLAARLDHPNIVQTYEVGCEGDRLFMTLELLEGCSLHEAKKKIAGGLPVRLALRVLSGVLAALHHAHEQGVVHRDVSAQNVFVTYDGRVKLLDFGVAKTRHPGRAETKVGVLKGSIPYMSPDHADGGTIDRRADIFAVGVHLRELVTGERVWGDLDDVAILRQLVVRELPAFPGETTAPQPLRAIAERAMAPRRGDRYSTALEMKEAIDDYLAEVDPRGSLAELGLLLERALPGQRASLRAVADEAARATDTAFAATVPSVRDPISLPSSELQTDVGSAAGPAAPPPRARGRGLVALFAAALAVAAIGVGVTTWMPTPAAVSAVPATPPSAATAAEPAAHAAETAAMPPPAASIATVSSPSLLDSVPPEADAPPDGAELPPNPYGSLGVMQTSR
ncbi:MAG: serine/threonine protein kinase [Deltaproteobacteria bacterium]|nr:serine/threonine protein kinase [Deltaproteobacteria bacterium]